MDSDEQSDGAIRDSDRCDVMMAEPGTSNEPSTSEHKSGKNISKRAAAKQRIEQYYFQVTEGCGRANCSNPVCASAPQGLKVVGNDAAVKALELFKTKAQLCDLNPRKVARTENHRNKFTKEKRNNNEEMGLEADSAMETDVVDHSSMQPVMEDVVNKQLESISVSSKNEAVGVVEEPSVRVKEIPYLTEDIIHDLLNAEDDDDKHIPLIRMIGKVFSSAESLARSFLKKICNPEMKSTNVTENQSADKVFLRSINIDHRYEKPNCTLSKEVGDHIKVDLEALRRVYAQILPIECIQNALVNSLLVMSTSLKFDIRRNSKVHKSNPNFLNIFIIIMENTSLHSPEYLDEALPAFCMAMAALPLEAQLVLVKIWSTYKSEDIQRMVEVLQQLITFKVVCQEGSANSSVNEEENVIAATKCLRIFYYASIYGGKIDCHNDTNGAVPARTFDRDNMDSVIKDPLAELLGVSALDSLEPLIPLRNFINNSLDDSCEVAQDYLYSKNLLEGEQYFSFFGYPFVFDTATKTTYLFYDNKVRMTSERRAAMISSFMLNTLHIPYLKLKVRRDHVIQDAMLSLDIVVMDNPDDLRKQLFVEFEGEQGVDEGGVSKEFFQLVVEKLFDPVYGMFTYNEDSHVYWFNHATYFDSFAEFKLVGILLGLAMYNNCLLNIRFPKFLYKKLMGKKARFCDMKESHPVLYNGLRELLSYEGDTEEDMMATFDAGYQDSFGTIHKHELKPEGSLIPVTNDNRQEYVDLYTDWLLNESISEQFTEFRAGFELVVRDSPIKHLFLPDEIELIICGSESYDFKELEETTEYDGGFTQKSETIVDFWSVVHEMTSDEQQNLLQFTTGTNRAPVGGLSKVKLIIAKNGPDSDRLPTAHTCFNVLLLPNYENRDKLKERLLKAIKYSQGFGML